MTRIAIGSKNPVKIAAVKEATAHVWEDAEFMSVKADSRVNEQPTSDEEAVRGAMNRAHDALKQVTADIGIGLEGGVVDTDFGMFLTGWVAVVDQERRTGLIRPPVKSFHLSIRVSGC